MPLTAESVVFVEAHDGTTPLDPGFEFRLPTTERIYDQLLLDQGLTNESCGAHAVAAAMETYLVEHHAIGTGDALVDPLKIFEAVPRRSLRWATQVAALGVETRIGTVKPVCFNFDAADPAAMAFDLGTRRVPLMIEAIVDDGFVKYGRSDIYDQGGWDPHGICVIGYGSEAQTGRQYWVAKNSYGEGWGDHGYVRLSRDFPIENVYALRSLSS